MNRSVIAVRTANRPTILDRCLAATVEGCDVTRNAHWLVLDDSSSDHRQRTREIVDRWKAFGLRLTYVDKDIETIIADALPQPTLRSFFVKLTARSPSNPAEVGRNLALLAGLSCDPELIFFVDDDMVHRHDENCFFHWCATCQRPDGFIAAPRKLGIADMMYLDRLAYVLERADWVQFISDTGITADADLWYSPRNPLWKRKVDGSDEAPGLLTQKDIVNGQFMAIHNRGTQWLPFPSGYNEDLNWSLLQSSCFGTAILKLHGVDVQHLPPCLGHLKAESIASEFVGTAITKAIRQIKPHGEGAMNTLSLQLPDALGVELKRGLFLLLDVERALLVRSLKVKDDTPGLRTLSNVKRTLEEVGARLYSMDPRKIAVDWLGDFAARNMMFQELRHSEIVQAQLRRTFFEGPVCTGFERF
jgi:hypothetical protein